jgi:hypothetical protein
MKHVSTVFSYLLLCAGAVMLSWGILGFLEYFFGIAPLMKLQNPTFPPGTQFIHWLLITLSGSVYLLGYFLKWKYTPLAMIVIYAMLATMCFIQTFDFMTNPSRYTDFARECIFYVIISAYLVRSRRMQTHFGRIEVN